MSTHVCATPGCWQLAPCEEHTRDKWDDRDMASHMRFSRAVRRRESCCQSCGATSDLFAHHVVPGLDDVRFGVLLCRSCHKSVDPKAR